MSAQGFLLPRASYGGEIDLVAAGTGFLALGPIAGGMVLGPVLVHAGADGAVSLNVRFGVGVSSDASAASLSASVGPVMFDLRGTERPGGPAFVFPAAGGQHTVSVPWGARTQGAASWVIVRLSSGAAVLSSLLFVVAARELILPGTPIVGPVSGFRRRSTDRES